MARKQSKAVIPRHFWSAPNQITSVVALVFAKNRQHRQKRHTKRAGEAGFLSRAGGWCSAGLQPGKALAVVAGDRAGAGADAGAQSGKPQAVARPALGAGTGVHPARPWVQALAQHWASTRQSPGHGHRFNAASPGRGGQ